MPETGFSELPTGLDLQNHFRERLRVMGDAHHNRLDGHVCDRLLGYLAVRIVLAQGVDDVPLEAGLLFARGRSLFLLKAVPGK